MNRVAGVDNVDLIPVDPLHVRGVSQHQKWLTAVVGEQGRSFQLAPVEIRVRLPAGKKKSIPSINEGEVHW